jgi:hypothetical protein
MERTTPSEMLIKEYQPILRHNPEDDGFVVKLPICYRGDVSRHCLEIQGTTDSRESNCLQTDIQVFNIRVILFSFHYIFRSANIIIRWFAITYALIKLSEWILFLMKYQMMMNFTRSKHVVR